MQFSFIKQVLLSTVILGFITGCSTQSEQHHWKKDETYHLTVLHTNDHHGRFWHNKYGEYGMAARKTLIDQIRQDVAAQGGSVLLFSGGDINTGVPESDLQDAEPDFKGMSIIGYDAMALGNHEFDNPLDVLYQQEKWANFPLLSANIYDKKTGKRLFRPYKIFDKQGIRIAVIGLTTEDTAKIGNPEYVEQIEFRDPKVEAKQVITELEKNEHPDLIFAVTHMGHYTNGRYGINAPGDVTLARSLKPGELAMIVGGHSQDPVCMEGPNVIEHRFKPGDACQPDIQNGTYIVQAHEWGKYVGRADYEFRNGIFKMVSYALIPVNLKKKVNVGGESKRVLIQSKIPENPALFNFLKPYEDKGQAQLGQKIATVKGRLEGDRDVVRFHQTNLGRLIATAQQEKAKADFGVMNSGGVRDSIDSGAITYKDVLKVQPFANLLTYVDMSGDEVLNYLNVVATKPVDSGAYAQFSGLSMTVGPQGVSNVLIGGQPIQRDRTYRVSLPSFSASGGDGYPKVTDHPGFVNTGFVDADVLKEYLQRHSPVDGAAYQPADEIIYQ